MSDTHLAAQEELLATYANLLVGLANLIDRDAHIDIVENLRKGRFTVVTQAIWDEAMKLADAQDNPGKPYIAASQAGHPFDYEAYAERVHELDAVKLGGFLWSWEHAQRKFGGLLKLNQAFRLLKGSDLDRMVENIYRLIERAA